MKRLIKISLLILTTSLISLYFLLQSSWVYLNYIIPRIEVYTGAKIKMASLDITPWRELTIKDLSVEDSKGVINNIGELKLHYQFLPIFSKEISIDEITIDNSALNLNSILNLLSSKKSGASKSSSNELYPDIGYKIALKELALKNSELTLTSTGSEQEKENTILLKSINLNAKDFTSEKGGDFSLAFNLSSDSNSPSPKKFKGKINSTLALSANRESLNLKIKSDFNEINGSLNNVNLEDASLDLKGELVYSNNKLTFKDLNVTAKGTNSPKYEILTNGEISLKERIEFVGDSQLKVTKDDLLLGDLNHKGSLLFSDNSTILDGELYSSFLELDQLLALIPVKKEANNTENKESNFVANLKVKLGIVSYKNIKLTEASSDIHFGDNLISGENLLMNINNAPLKGSFILSTIEPLFKPTIDLDIRNLELHPIVKAFNEKASKDLYGDIKRLTFRIKNSWEKKDKGLKERDGDLRATFTNLKIPAYLQDTPPINLLFLPIKALEYVSDQVGGAFLPESIKKTTEIVNTETRSGQIEFNEAQVQGLINGKGITLSNTKFNSYVLPTLHFNGNIDFNEDLNLAIGIEVLKVPIPLPVTGSLSLPLPDLIGFLPAIVKSLGTSFTNISSILDSDEEKEKEFFGDKD